MKKKIKFMLTAFRDGFQSVYGARVFSKDYMPAVEAAVDAGIEHLEAGGGAMFQSAYFYCNENAFDAMDKFRETAGKKVNLQTLARGINVVALDSQPKDIIKLHAELFKKHGMTTIRNFDALNDVNNLIFSGQCIKQAGLQHEVTVTMMELPPGCEGAHTPEFYTNVLKSILDANIAFDSVCFKDASGTSRPQKVYETVRMARKLLGDKMKIAFHSHETAGVGTVGYKAAIEAGADQVDLSIAPVSGGTCQPDILTMWHALRGTDYDLDIDIHKIIKLEEFFKNCMKDYFVPPEAVRVEPLIPFFPMPGGALTANTQMLRDNNLMDKYPEVIAAMGEAVAKGGFGTSVTPVSQFYFQQAFNNVMFGPWRKIAEGYGKMALGYFGKTPVEPDPEIVKIAEKQLNLPPTKRSPLEIDEENPKKGIAPAKKLLEQNKLPITDENIFITSACQEKGIAFLKGEGKVGVRKEVAADKKSDKSAATAGGYTVTLNNKQYAVKIAGTTASVNGTSYSYNVKEGIDEHISEKPATVSQSGSAMKSHIVDSPLPGIVLRVYLKPGDKVAVGETLFVVESMKMETPINSSVSGVIERLMVAPGDQIQANQPLASITTLTNVPASSITRAAEGKLSVSSISEKNESGNVEKYFNVESPLPGLILRIFLKPGDKVRQGETILVLESMKMETPINSTVTGVIMDIPVKQGEQIQAGALLAEIKQKSE